MKSLKGLSGGFVSECRVLIHCEAALMLFFAGIIFYSLLYPSAYLHEVPQKLPFYAVDQDHSTSSRLLMRQIGATEGIRLLRNDDLAQSMQGLRDGAVSGVLVVPDDFERKLLSGTSQSIPLYTDASHLLLYRMVLQGVRQVSEQLGAGTRMVTLEKRGMPPEAALSLQTRGRADGRLLYNPMGNYAINTVPPVFVLIIQQILFVGTGMLEVRRRRMGVPDQGVRWLCGRLLAPAFLAVIFAFYYFWILAKIDDLLPARRFFDVLLFLFPFFLTAAAVGNLAGRFFRHEPLLLTFVLPISIPILFTSGFVWPQEAMPDFIRALGALFPATPAINGYMLLAARGAAFSEILSLCLHEWALFLLYLLLALAASRKLILREASV